MRSKFIKIPKGMQTTKQSMNTEQRTQYVNELKHSENTGKVKWTSNNTTPETRAIQSRTA